MLFLNGNGYCQWTSKHLQTLQNYLLNKLYEKKLNPQITNFQKIEISSGEALNIPNIISDA